LGINNRLRIGEFALQTLVLALKTFKFRSIGIGLRTSLAFA
jgi:hypothetical protein